MTTSLQNLLDVQRQNATDVDRAIRNFKKDSVARKNKKYYEQRLAEFQGHKKLITETHQKIMAFPDDKGEYLSTHYPKLLKELEDALNMCLNGLERFKVGSKGLVSGFGAIPKVGSVSEVVTVSVGGVKENIFSQKL